MKRSKNKISNEILNGRNLVVVGIAVVLISIAYFAGVKSSQKSQADFVVSDIEQIADLSTKGFVLVKPEAGVVNEEGVISLTGNCYRVIAGTERHQAESIINVIGKKVVERPNTHDIFRDQLDIFGIKILMIKIVDIRNNNFIGKIILKQGDRGVSLESKPSDGIALAVRTNSSVYMNETLMKKYGEKVC